MANDLWSNLISFGSLEFLALLGLAAAKATLLLAIAALLCLIFRRFSAATRHLLWACVLCGSLLLPFLSFGAIWEVPILPAAAAVYAPIPEVPDKSAEPFAVPVKSETASAEAGIEAGTTVPEPAEFQKSANSLADQNAFYPPAATGNALFVFPQIFNWALIVWLAGVLLFLSRIAVGFGTSRFLARRAVRFENSALNEMFSALLAELKIKAAVRLLRSQNASMPVVCGILRPAVLLPPEAESWSRERQKMVLLHELTHVARRDCLTQLVAQLACAFYWFNPFVWAAERRLRVEREQACDDYVLSVGTKPSDYAQHLLEIARSLNDRSAFEWSRPATVAIARKSQLEGRLLAILRQNGTPRNVSHLTTAAIVALICLLLFALAMIRPTAIKAYQAPVARSAANLETGGAAKKTLLESFWSSGPADETPPEEKTKQEAAARADDPDPLDGLQKADPAETEAGENSDRHIGAPAPEADAAAETAPANQPVPPPAPESAPENLPAPNSFLNAGFEREPKTPSPERAGDFIDEMASVGYTNLSVNELIRLKQAGVTAEYVRSLQAVGFVNLPVRELASLALYGVTPAYVQAIRNAGYNDLSARELANFRMHNVTPEFIKSLRGAGYDNLPARQVADFAAHQITPAFIGAMRGAGFADLAPRELINLRIYDVTPEFIRQARSRHGELTVKQIISLKTRAFMKKDPSQDNN